MFKGLVIREMCKPIVGDAVHRSQDGCNEKARWWKKRLKVTLGCLVSLRPACDKLDPVSNQIEKVKKQNKTKKKNEPADWINQCMRSMHITCSYVHVTCMCRPEVDIGSLPQLLSTLWACMYLFCVHRWKSEDKLGVSGLPPFGLWVLSSGYFWLSMWQCCITWAWRI